MLSLTIDLGQGCLAGVPALFGYLDPGSGSMAVQVLIAGLLSGMFFLKSSVGYLKGKLVAIRSGR